jgi:NADPH-dependent 2,4-dienoyl-CoA reductase/sulfur reductase-like enzyme
MGTIAAYNLFDDTVEYKGTQGTSGVKVYSYNVFTTGLSQQFAEERNLDVKTIFTIENNRPEFMPEYEKVYIKIVYDDKTKRILGGQIMSKANVAESINTLSLAISNNMTLVDLAFSDFFFQPHFNKPWNFLNTVALKAIQ